MRRSIFLKPLAVVTSLLLGMALVWYQASLIRGEPAAAPVAEPSPENHADSPGAPAPVSEIGDPSVKAEALELNFEHGRSYFSPSKSSSGMVPVIPRWLTKDAMMEPLPSGENAPASASPHYFGTSKSAMLPGIALDDEMIDAIPGLRERLNALTGGQPPSGQSHPPGEDSNDEEGKQPVTGSPSYFPSSKSIVFFQPSPPPVKEADE